MPKERTIVESRYFTLEPHQLAILYYYSAKQKNDVTRVLRDIIEHLAAADTHFDSEDFKNYAKTVFSKRYTDAKSPKKDPEFAKALRAGVDKFLKTYC